jgi:hypothetical protein
MIKDVVSKCLEKGIEEVKKPENIEKIQINVVDPMINHAYKKLYPYFLVTIIIFILTFILALMIFMLLLKQTLKKN